MGRIYDSNTAWMASEKETTFKTAAARTRQFNFDREQVPEVDAPQVTDIEQYTGYDEPTKSQIPGIMFPFSLSMARATPDAIGYMFAMAMGLTVTAAIVDNTVTLDNAKRHLISRANQALLPSCTWERRQSGSYAELYRGSVCNRASIRYEQSRERFLTLESDWLGAQYNRTTTPTTVIGEIDAGTDNEEDFVEFLAGGMKFGTFANDTATTNLDLMAGTPTINWAAANATDNQILALTGFSYEYNNNIDREQAFRSGAGIYPHEFNRGQITETATATFVKNDAFDHIMAVANNTNYSLEIFARGKQNDTKTDSGDTGTSREGIRLLWPRFSMSNPRDSVVGNETRTTVDLAIKRKSATVKASYIQVFNRRASYPQAA